MDTPHASPPTTPRKRLGKRTRVLLVLLAVVAPLLAGAYVPGTWADTTLRDPGSPADGVVCHLYRTPDGHTPVRCAVLLDYPIDKVWKVITDYDRYGEIFPTLRSAPVKVT